MGLEALTKLLRKEVCFAGTASFSEVDEEEKPRPCLNLAAPPPFRVSSS